MTRFASITLLLVLTGGLAYLGWTTLKSDSHETCSVCARPVHLASRVDGVAGAEELTFCCAACALHAQENTFPDLKVTRVFDYSSGNAISPEDATVVVGSEVNLCMREHMVMNDRIETSELQYDRCSPSVLAFANREAAEKFRAEHGGVTKSFTELLRSFP